MWWIWVLIVVAMCVLYTASRTNIRIEPFGLQKTPPDALKEVKALSSEAEDAINIDKYREEYEDLIIEYTTWAQRKRVLMVASPELAKSKEKITEFNDLSLFIEGLNHVMVFIDKKT